MKAVIDRSLCMHTLSECVPCFSRFIRNPSMEDRVCISEFVYDDDPTLTLTLKYDFHEETFLLSREQRELMARVGWPQFVKIKPKMT